MDCDTRQHDKREEWLLAIRFARAYLGLRGFEISNISAEDARAYVEDEITLDELLRRSIPSRGMHRLLNDLYPKTPGSLKRLKQTSDEWTFGTDLIQI